jgi:serine protease Do
MSVWVLAAATTAMLGAAAWGPKTFAQGPHWTQGVEELTWSVPEEFQRVQMLGAGGRVGVTIRDLGDDDFKGKTAGMQGVMIDEVETDSPAAKAGFKAGDIVVEFDGERVRSARQFTRLVQETPAARQVAAVVLREGQRVTLNVQPREGDYRYSFGNLDALVGGRPLKAVPVPPAKMDIRPLVPKFEMFGTTGRLGISVEELTPQLAEYFGTKDGVLVRSVTASSSASKAGLKAGDVITGLDGGTIATADDLRRRAQRLEDGDEFSLAIVRDKKAMTLKGKIEAQQIRRSTRTVL